MSHGCRSPVNNLSDRITYVHASCKSLARGTTSAASCPVTCMEGQCDPYSDLQGMRCLFIGLSHHLCTHNSLDIIESCQVFFLFFLFPYFFNFYFSSKVNLWNVLLFPGCWGRWGGKMKWSNQTNNNKNKTKKEKKKKKKEKLTDSLCWIFKGENTEGIGDWFKLSFSDKLG